MTDDDMMAGATVAVIVVLSLVFCAGLIFGLAVGYWIAT